MSSLEITCKSVLERRSPSQPRYAIVPATQLAPEELGNPVTVEGTLNGFDLGPVKLRMRQDEQWEIDLAAALCAKAQVATGDPVTLHLRLASDEIPDELQALLDTEPLARTKWLELSDGEQRVLRDRVRSGRLPETRARRAREGLV
ncbi:MAG: YdeI/OmpD-associated family protein [Longimicrobiales bacterium]